MTKMVKFNWTLGNGETSTSKSPATIYTPGAYTVTIETEDELGNPYSHTEVLYINVGENDQGLNNPRYLTDPKSYHFGWADKTGRGWSENAGDDWIWPLTSASCSVMELNGEKILMAWDSRDSMQYIIDPRIPTYVDKADTDYQNGTEIATEFITSEYTGEMKQYELTHLETNIKMLPALDQDALSEELEVSFGLIVDEGGIPVEVTANIDTEKEIEFYFSNQQTSPTTQRQLQMTTNRSDFRLDWIGSYFINEDKLKTPRTNSRDEVMAYFSDVTSWYTRGKGYEFDRATGAISSIFSGIPATGMDGWSDSAFTLDTVFSLPTDHALIAVYWIDDPQLTDGNPILEKDGWTLIRSSLDEEIMSGATIFDHRVLANIPEISAYAETYSQNIEYYLPRY